jgi:heme exporter protein D
MHLGPYASFIVAAYATALAVVAGLIGWVIVDHRAQTRTLHDLEGRGIGRRRSSRQEAL